MTAGAFLSDRLGRLVLWLTSMAVGALFLLATGTGRAVSYTHLTLPTN